MKKLITTLVILGMPCIAMAMARQGGWRTGWRTGITAVKPAEPTAAQPAAPLAGKLDALLKAYKLNHLTPEMAQGFLAEAQKQASFTEFFRGFVEKNAPQFLADAQQTLELIKVPAQGMFAGLHPDQIKSTYAGLSLLVSKPELIPMQNRMKIIEVYNKLKAEVEKLRKESEGSISPTPAAAASSTMMPPDPLPFYRPSTTLPQTSSDL